MPAEKKPTREDSPQSELSESPELDLYGMLGVKNDATEGEIKTAYKKLALKYHPDKVKGDKDEATKQFQDLTWAYAILSDENRRKVFDTTGSTEAAAEGDEDFNWTDFWNTQFQNIVNLELLDEQKIKYQGSEQEHKELLAAFDKFEGDMDRVFEEVVFSSVLDDEDRFRGIIDRAIADGEVEGYKAYTQEPAKKKQRRHKRAEREAREAAEEKTKLKKRAKKDAGESDLAALIQSRQANRKEDFISRLEAEAKELERPKKKRKGT